MSVRRSAQCVGSMRCVDTLSVLQSFGDAPVDLSSSYLSQLQRNNYCIQRCSIVQIIANDPGLWNAETIVFQLKILLSTTYLNT